MWLHVDPAIAWEFALGGGKTTSLEGIYLGQSLTFFSAQIAFCLSRESVSSSIL